MSSAGDTGVEPIAIVGMACRVPGAGDVAQFWRNLVDGVESVTVFTREQQASSGVPEAHLDDPAFVPAAPVLDDMEYFDAGLFGMTPREAEVSDPQQRLFLELAHTALEDAGHDPARFRGPIGVYGGMGPDYYLWRHLQRSRRLAELQGSMTFSIGAGPDYLATFVSYKLDLHGPSFTLYTACSTSLVAAHLACEALRGGECDMALAGGVCIELPHRRGYVYQEGGVVSPDGHCRPFDASAGGTLWGSGGGMLVLRRLADALAGGDHVRAVILGSAVNNDGAGKVGFTAPSVSGQAEVVALALGMAGVEPRSIDYVEAHGTGTALGDPIEVAALSTAFGRGAGERGWCGIGSVKSNIGHLSQGAGAVAAIKTVLAMEHGLIPATLHFERPNPAIDLASTPFRVVAALSAWERGGRPRRASVSSFGFGGTNAHLVLEEAPAPGAPAGGARPAHLVRVSARSEAALDAAVARLATHLEAHRELDLADVAFTLRAGRAAHPHRAAVAARDTADAAAALRDPRRLVTGSAGAPPRVALLFSGQGSQHAGMGAELYRTEAVFRRSVDECVELVRGDLGEDLLPLLLAGGEAAPDADARLRRTALAQPALFILEHALAELWRSWGVRPAAAVGHSIGEYAAATLAGVFTLPDALRLVVARGRLMQALPEGAMLAVPLAETEIAARLPADLSVATVNGPKACVVSGPAPAVERLAAALAADRVACRRLRTSHAFHSPMMEPILEEFRAAVAAVERRAPELPYLSNVTGDWITAGEATDPAYWSRQLREPVRFSGCVGALHRSGGDWLLLECGPGRQLAGLARLQLPAGARQPLASLPAPGDRRGGGDVETMTAAAARLWTAGVAVEAGGPGRRVPLPTYPYERRYHWVDEETESAPPAEPAGPLPADRWFSVPAWRQAAPVPADASIARCLAFVAGPRGEAVAAALRRSGAELVEVAPGEAYGGGPARFRLRPGRAEDHRALLADLAGAGGVPERVVHAWALDGEPAGAEAAWRAQDLGFFSLLWLTQALAATSGDGAVHLDALTVGAQDVIGGDLARPEHATVTAIARVVPRELPAVSVRVVDLDPRDDAGAAAESAVAELRRPATEELVALRGGRRWLPGYEAAQAPAAPSPGLRERGVYLITGGTGGIGITVAEDFACRAGARLVLMARSALPPREAWGEHLRSRGEGDRAGRAIAAIRRAETAGGEVLVVTGDVTSVDDLRRVREDTLARFGRLDGIVHAAGLPGGGMAEVKERAAAEAVLAPKLRGTLALREAFGDLPLDFVVLCSSVTALAGGLGQVDYCAANAFLDAHARSAHGWRARVVSIDWGAWLDVGMAVETEVPDALRTLGRDERASAIDHPVFDTRHDAGGRLPWFSGRVSPESHWLLDEHRLDGHPLLPGTAYLELARWAFEAAVPRPPGHVVELRDVVFVEPLSVPEGGTAELRLSLTDAGGEVRFEASTAAGAPRVHARGAVVWARPGPAPAADLEAIRARCRREAPQRPSSMLRLGPRWESLRGVQMGDREEVALLELPATVLAELDRWPLHPAAVDRATGFQTPEEGSYLPLGYGRVLARGPLPARLWAHLRPRDAGSGQAVVADVSLLDDAGREVVAIEEFVLRRIDIHATTASLAPGRRPAARAAAAPPGMVGIRPAGGVEALHRVLAADLGPQVVVSARALDRVLADARRLDAAAVESEMAPAGADERPDRIAGSPYVAPRTDLESTVARIWSDVLGIGRIGVEDEFFELGGNSLVAVQLIGRIRAVTGVRLPMRALFDTPTVAGMAELVERLQAEGSVAPAAPIHRLARRGG